MQYTRGPSETYDSAESGQRCAVLLTATIRPEWGALHDTGLTLIAPSTQLPIAHVASPSTFSDADPMLTTMARSAAEAHTPLRLNTDLPGGSGPSRRATTAGDLRGMSRAAARL